MPVGSRSTAALNRRYLAKLGSSTSTAGSGYRPNACGVAATASTAPPVAIMVRLVGSMGVPPRFVDGSGEYRVLDDGRQTTDDRRQTTDEGKGREPGHGDPSSVLRRP